MSKATCLPHREKERDKYVCGICSTTPGYGHQDYGFSFLVTHISPEAEKLGFNEEMNQELVVCNTCLKKLLIKIETMRCSHSYYQTRCKQLEKMVLETSPSFEISKAQVVEEKKLLAKARLDSTKWKGMYIKAEDL